MEETNTNPILQEFEDKLDLEPDEQIITATQRTNMSYYIPKIWRNIISFIIFFAIAYFIGAIFTSIKIYVDNVVEIIIYIWIGIFVISLLVGTKFVAGHVYIITTKRIIMQRKFLSIMFREIEFKRITDLVLHQSLWGRILNFGTLLPVTAGVEMGAIKLGVFSIEGIKDVFAIRLTLLSQIRQSQEKILRTYFETKEMIDKKSLEK